jgi:hypothetical protein
LHGTFPFVVPEHIAARKRGYCFALIFFLPVTFRRGRDMMAAETKKTRTQEEQNWL